MKGKVDPVERVLNCMDAFGQPVTFKADGMSSYSSGCGTFTTLCVAVILLIYSWLKIFSIRESDDEASESSGEGLLRGLDFLSGVGGLAFFLYLLGHLFVKLGSTCFGRNSDLQLLQALYKRDPDFDGDTKSSRRSTGTKRSPLRNIERRKGFVM